MLKNSQQQTLYNYRIDHNNVKSTPQFRVVFYTHDISGVSSIAIFRQLHFIQSYDDVFFGADSKC
jgi:hypothetical protein